MAKYVFMDKNARNQLYNTLKLYYKLCFFTVFCTTNILNMKCYINV